MDSLKNVSDVRCVDPKQNETHGLFLILIMAVLGLLTIFVETMLVPGLPIMADNLAARSSDLAWVLTAYTLAGVISVPIVGKLGEMWGRKLVLLLIMLIYTLGIIGAALSWDLLSLIVFRTLQGVGMGAVPILMGMAKDILPTRLVAVGLGLISAMMGVGAGLGLVGGGLIISAVGWKNAFWVVLPVVVFIVAVVNHYVPDRQQKVRMPLDLVGAALLGLGLLTLLLALSRGPVWGWGSVLTIGLFACTVVLFTALYAQERNYSEPIIDLRLMKNRNISSAYVSMLLIGTVMFMLFQTLPYFLEMPAENGGFGITSQVMIGLFLLPNAITQLIFSPVGGKFGQKIGHWKILVIGMFITAVGLILLSAFHSSEVSIIISVSIFGMGLGLATVGDTNMLSHACSKENFGSATAVNSMILTIGMSIGPVAASLIIGGFGNAANGYAWSWGAAAVLAILAALLVLSNKAYLGVEGDAKAPHQERL
jgi:MFS family permease